MQITNINQAKANLSELIRWAIAGEEVIIARASEPLVRLQPLLRDTRPRTGGQWKDQVKMSVDFDAVDQSIERLFHDGPIFPKTMEEP